MKGRKFCPTCGCKRTHIGITRKCAGGFFLIPSICTGFEIVRKCENGHYWTKTWRTCNKNQ